VVHHADLAKDEQVLVGAIPVTAPLRTLLDCAEAHVSPELMAVAVRQARARGMIRSNDLKAIRARERAA